MEWMNSNLKEIEPTNIANQEQKEKIAKKIAQKVKDGDVIGFEFLCDGKKYEYSYTSGLKTR